MSAAGFASSKNYNGPPPSYDAISPLTNQPDTFNSAVFSNPIKGISPGLECLTQVNQLLVQEKFTTAQRIGRAFQVMNEAGQQMFQANEQVRCCRSVPDLTFRDPSGRGVIDVTQNCKCSCSEIVIEVNASPGQCIGYVAWMWNTFATHIVVKNINQEAILLILGPGLQTCIFGNVNFEIKSRDEQHTVGMIRSENDTFVVSFPVDLDVTIKALLLAAGYYLNTAIYGKRRQVANRPSN
ncbi:phospholipid scramblase 3 [Bombina bombina]|uniref:phospholipid scramblase 3 n=1 Tax=Bombina bombina TaxID=8345 RepID=UPI00235B010F|nr:phospholipid scramblase 3 [Bombina bombina]XP_053574400.1 phospholipid scramblase 3 [Bombina bombina]